MNEEEYLISGLQTQRNRISEVINNLEYKQKFDSKDYLFYEFKIKEIRQNLKDLQKIAKDKSRTFGFFSDAIIAE